LGEDETVAQPVRLPGDVPTGVPGLTIPLPIASLV